MSLLQKIKNHGIVHSVEIVFNRVVPPWLFRFSVGIVYELDAEKRREWAEESAASDYVLECVETPEARERLRELTWNSVPKETSSAIALAVPTIPNAPWAASGEGSIVSTKPTSVLKSVWHRIKPGSIVLLSPERRDHRIEIFRGGHGLLFRRSF